MIKLLPNHLANQIAAGEVIQRPASVLKELVENAIDAQAENIKIIIEEAGKKTIQVIDDGNGMDPFNLRMCFQRHATSKIKDIDDLFQIATKGFRGEALASIAAVAQVEVRSKTESQEIGSSLFLENSEVVAEEHVAMDKGTNFIIKNLFYNVPARRKFLKSNNVEFRHIAEEFIKIALAHPDLNFQLYHNGKEQFHVRKSNYKNRIIALLGSRYESELIPVEEETDIVNIRGFIGGPKVAIKTRGNQYFFVNNRYIKSPYLHHAIRKAYEDIIDSESYPLYVLYLEIDLRKVDINVHPTKQEVKFEEESLLYAYLHAAVKHALAKYNITPSMDFELDEGMERTRGISQPMTNQDEEKLENSYIVQSFNQKGKAHFIPSSNDRKEWEKQKGLLGITTHRSMENKGDVSRFPKYPEFEDVKNTNSRQEEVIQNNLDINIEQENSIFIYREPYIITSVKSGVVFIHAKRALERIFYERQWKAFENQRVVSQQLLFPVDISIAPADRALLEDAKHSLRKLGYELQKSEDKKYQLLAIPIHLPNGREQDIIDYLIESLRLDNTILEDDKRKDFLKGYVRSLVQFKKISKEEVPKIISDLFSCIEPSFSPRGQVVLQTISEDNMRAMFSD